MAVLLAVSNYVFLDVVNSSQSYNILVSQMGSFWATGLAEEIDFKICLIKKHLDNISELAQ